MHPLDLRFPLIRPQDNGMMLRTPDAAAPDEEYFYHASDLSTEQVRDNVT